MKNVFSLQQLLKFAPALLLGVFLLFSGGCQQTPRAGETYRKGVFIWPIYVVEKSAGQTDDGSRWDKEKGTILLLGFWEKEKRYDKNDFLNFRKETSTFIPFYSDQEEETKEFREHKGSILLFPYYSKKAKTSQTGK